MRSLTSIAAPVIASCIRWATTRSGSRPRTTRSRPASILARRPTRRSRHTGTGFTAGGSRSTGRRELGTHEPSYYRWTQWIFLRLLERGLAYRKEAAVKWCPFDQTVLANEQVIDGRCERCGNEVEVRQLEQWFFRITDYADRLLDDLDRIDWPEHVKAMQRNWIGRSEGAEVTFRCEELGIDYAVFTTRPDTLFGATFFVMAPEHPGRVQARRRDTSTSSRSTITSITRSPPGSRTAARSTSRRPAPRSAARSPTRSTASRSRCSSPTTC